MQYVEDVHESAVGELQSLDDVISVGIVPSDEEIAGHLKMELRVSYDEKVDRNTIEDLIPESYRGVNVRLRKIPRDKQANCDLDDQYDPVPGSVIVAPGNCTLCGRAYYNTDPYNKYVILTAAHCFDACDSPITGDSGYQSEWSFSSREIGEVLQYNENQDWAAIDLEGEGDFDVTGDIVVEGGDQPELAGIYTSYANLIDEGMTVYKSGIAWDHREGECVSYNESAGSDCPTLGGDGVETNMNTGGGDSGGPQYVLDDNDKPLLVCMTTHRRGDEIEDSPCRGSDSSEHGLGISSEALSEHNFEFWR